jgi:DNA-binding GntR family transcriptional regulator
MSKSASPPARRAAADELKGRILRARWTPGRQVKPGDVARELKIGLTPSREALIELEVEGWLVNEPQRGFFVTNIRSDEVYDLYPVIAELEGLAVRSIDRVEPGDVDRLARLNEAFGAAVDLGSRVRADADWHEALVALAENPILAGTASRLRARAQRYEHFYMAAPSKRADSLAEHEAILGALCDGDFAKADELVRSNWMKMLTFLER